MAEPEIEEAAMAAELETGCDVDINVAREEATWYSILNVFALSLGSGMGLRLDQSESDDLMRSAGINWNNLPFSNPALLKAFFKTGDPHLVKQFDLWNLETWRWASDSFDPMLVPQAQGWSVIAETECAKWFAIPLTTESIPRDMRDQWRALSMLFWSLAGRQCDFAFDNLRDDKGLFIMAARQGSMNVLEPGNNLADQACMLWAVSDLAALAGQSDSIFANNDLRSRLLRRADDLFEAIVDNKDILISSSVNPALDQSIAICALVWYASTTNAQDLRARCLWLLREFADNLVRMHDQNEMVGNTLVDAAASMRALVEAFRVTRLRTYAETSVQIFNFMESQWSKAAGVYSQTPLSPEYTFNADDVGMILGALNAGRLFLKDRVDRELADLRMRIFFCKAVNVSGLQMSMPGPEFMPDWLRQRELDIHFRYASVPLPGQAGGDFGIAPVFAGEVSFDPQESIWSRRMLFDTPAAMHCCCELIWLNHEAINGFPDIRLEEAPIAVRQAAGIEPSV